MKEERLIIYEAPSGVTMSTYTSVLVNEKTCPVYETRINNKHTWKIDFNPPISSTPVTYFDFEGKVEVKVAVDKNVIRGIKSVTVRPLKYGITPAIDENNVTFTLTEPGFYAVEYNGKTEHTLHLFANPIEEDKPDPKDPNVIYLAPGLYTQDAIDLESGKSLYIAGGAVFQGMVRAENVENIKIYGRGIIDGSRFDIWKRVGSKQPFRVVNCKNVTLEGVIILDANAWSVNALDCEDVHYNNVKVISARPNGDGISFQSSQNCVIENCFVRSWDDSLVVKNWEGNKTDHLLFKNCYLWTDLAQSMEIGYETNKRDKENAIISNVRFEDITILHNFHKPIISIHNSDDCLVTDITYKNIVVEDAQMGFGDAGKNNQLIDIIIKKSRWSTSKKMGQIRNVTIDNVNVLGGKNCPNRIRSHSKSANVENVTIKDLLILGRKIKNAEDGCFSVDSNTKNISFL